MGAHEGNSEDARYHLLQARLLPSPGDPIFGIFWRAAFEAGVDLPENSVEGLQSIAGYMLAHPGREIFKEELVQKLGLHRESFRAALSRSLCGGGQSFVAPAYFDR
jgi:hypothetical protein